MDAETISTALTPYLPFLAWVVLVAAITFLALRSTGKIIYILYSRLNLPRGSYLTLKALVKTFIVFAAGVLVLIAIPGINDQAVALIGIGIGVVVSLSSTSTIGNAVAGVILHLSRPIHEGDRVDIEGVEGDVVSIELMFVHVKTLRGDISSIPSLSVLTSRIVNYSSLDEVATQVSVSLGYDVSVSKAEELLVAAARETSDVIDDPKPFVLVSEIGDHAVSYDVYAYTDKPNRLPRIESELRKNVLAQFSCAGVQVMSPAQHTVRQRDGNEKVIPESGRQVCNVDDREVGEESDEEDLSEAKAKIERKKKADIKLKEKS